MLYVQLDTNWPDHHKIIDAGVDGAGAHAIILCLAKRLEKDGWVRRSVLRRYGIDADLITRLVELDLLEDGTDAVRPAGWLDRNPSQAAIEARRATKIEAGKRGNHERWHHPGAFEDCAKCHPEEQVVAGCDPTESECETGAIASHRTPTKSKYEVATAIAPAIDLERHPVPRIPDDVRQTNLTAVAKLKAERFPLSAEQSNPAASGDSVVSLSAGLSSGAVS